MAIGALAVVAVLVVAASIWPLRSTNPVPLPTATPLEPPSPSAAALPVATDSPSVAEPPVASQVLDRWPGRRENPAGVYSWSGALAWMHNPTDKSVGVEMTFSSVVIDEASGPTTGGEIRSDWISEEAPTSSDGVRTELWTADFGNRRVSITVQAQPETTPAERVEAHLIIKSIRSEPTETEPFRLTFRMPGGWDSG